MRKIIFVLLLSSWVFLPCCSCFVTPPLPFERKKVDGGLNIEHEQESGSAENGERLGDAGSFFDSYREGIVKEAVCRSGLKRTCRPVKACSDGIQSCVSGSWGPCEGFRAPGIESCNGSDDDCDGIVDNPKCYTGPPNTMNVGLCSEGVYVCRKSTNSKVNVCTNERLPQLEVCDLQDNDCDGLVDEGGVCNLGPNTQDMIKIPEGVFLMGSEQKVDEHSGPNERPHMKVTLSSYMIDKYEVTNQSYKKCVDAKKCSPPVIDVGKFDSRFPKDYFSNNLYSDYPVVGVTWWDAKSYCQWRGKDLPTEAQWERAAKGAIRQLNSPWPKYPWGEEIPALCDFANLRIEKLIKGPDNQLHLTYFYCGFFPARVGSYQKDKTPEGIYDMAGNVLEWTKDCYSNWYGLSKEVINPVQLECDKVGEPNPKRYSSVRGGSFKTKMLESRTTSRRGREGNKASIWLGFRCVKN